ncbi:hypothetical protein ILP97_48415 [Amycolatopsis sp. H6(2020)]|nr:hypothetical protein [Amycolatopsis sp. H6(2020)]
MVKTLNVVLRAVLPSPLGRGVGEFMLLAFAGRTTPMRGVLVEGEAEVARSYLDRMTELGMRRAARMIGLKFPAGRLPGLDEVVELVRREHFGVVRLSVRT